MQSARTSPRKRTSPTSSSLACSLATLAGIGLAVLLLGVPQQHLPLTSVLLGPLQVARFDLWLATGGLIVLWIVVIAATSGVARLIGSALIGALWTFYGAIMYMAQHAP